MAEGPQVLLRTTWLQKQLVGKRVLNATTPREALRDAANRMPGRCVERVACRGKHIFIRFEDGLLVHNHLLMQGRWRRYPGGMLIPPDGLWLALDTGAHTVCNLKGQVLEPVSDDEARAIVARLGPDAMGRPFPADAIREALAKSHLAVSEALLDQTVVAGVGNTAKSEILFRAAVSPDIPAAHLDKPSVERLLDAVEAILWESFDIGGRWIHRVYRRRGAPCPRCRTPIRMVRRAPSRRSTYFCPGCQRGERTLF